MRMILLCRPDLLYSSGIHNAGTKVTDNGITLNWLTTNTEARKSPLYSFANHIIGCQQVSDDDSPDWMQVYWQDCDIDAIFKALLRLTWHRPRDFVTLCRILRENRKQGLASGPVKSFTWDDIKSPSLVRKYSDYMLSEVRDYSLFYMTPDEFDLFLSFFQDIGGKAEFDFQYFKKSYEHFIKREGRRLSRVSQIVDGHQTFLQFLYEMNIIAYKETADDAERFVHWAYRERSPAELRPRVKMEVTYEIHKGIAKALNIGKTMRVVSRGNKKK